MTDFTLTAASACPGSKKSHVHGGLQFCVSLQCWLKDQEVALPGQAAVLRISTVLIGLSKWWSCNARTQTYSGGITRDFTA